MKTSTLWLLAILSIVIGSNSANAIINQDTPEMMVIQMLDFALYDGGINHEPELQQLKIRIENLPKPEKGNRKLARTLNNKGLESVKKDDFVKAIELFKEAHELDKSDIEIMGNLGFSYLRQGNLEYAQKTIITTLTMSPSRGTEWTSLGDVFGLMGEIDKAVACYANTFRFSNNRLKTLQKFKKFNENESAENLKKARIIAINWAEKAYPNISNVEPYNFWHSEHIDKNKAVEGFTKSAQAGSSNAVAMIKKLPPEQPMSSPATTETPYTPSYSYAPPDYGESSTSTTMFLIMLFMLILPFVVFTFRQIVQWKNKKIRDINESINGQIRDITRYIEATINSHIETLSLKRRQMIMRDDYGNVFDDKWQREIDYFIDKVLKKDRTLKNLLDLREKLDGNADLLENYKKERGAIAYSAWVKHPTRSDIQGMIIRAVALHDELRRQDGAEHYGNIDIEPLSPIEFEHFCADILEANGWQARVTQASGDQGIDVIAEYGGKKAIFQCKKYSSPIGNKAVQEAIAGKQFAGASIAAVVSNATYTPSAKQLANTTDVYLLHYSELAQFKERIGIDSNAL